MRVTLILVAVACNLLRCNNSASSKVEQDECKRGTDRAIADLEADSLGLCFFGLPNPRLDSKIRIFKNEYCVRLVDGGDVTTEEGTCYNRIMEQAIMQRFGPDIFKRIDRRLDSLSLLGQGDRDVFYPGGSKAIEQYLACHLNFFDVDKSTDIIPTVFAKITIDSLGKVKKVSIVKGRESATKNERMAGCH
jgi:hypothetical protein